MFVKEAGRGSSVSVRLVLTLCLAVVGVAALAGAVGQARHKPLWHDELYTFYIAATPSLRALLATFTVPVDFNPPGYFVLAFLARAAFGLDPVAIRLPAILGFGAALLALFAFVHRLAGRAAAVAASAALALSGAYPYAYEARPYGTVLGLSALALLFWQRATRDGAWWWHVALSLALAAAVATQYYAVLLFATLGIAEFVRWVERRRIPWALVAAAVSSMGVLVPLSPMMRAVRRFQADYWSPPTTENLLAAYRDLAGPLVLSLLVIIAALVLTRMVFASRDPAGARDSDSVAMRAEVVALVALAAMPVVVCYSLARFTGAFAPRYVIEASLGIAALAGLVVAVIEARSKAWATLLVLVLVGLVGGKALPSARFIAQPPQDPIPAPARKAFEIDNMPIAFDNVLKYVQWWHYAPSDVRERLVSLNGRDQAGGWYEPSTGSRNLAMLARLVPVHGERYVDFVASHDRFLLLAPGPGIVDALLHAGATMSLVAFDGDNALYDVKLR